MEKSISSSPFLQALRRADWVAHRVERRNWVWQKRRNFRAESHQRMFEDDLAFGTLQKVWHELFFSPQPQMYIQYSWISFHMQSKKKKSGFSIKFIVILCLSYIWGLKVQKGEKWNVKDLPVFLFLKFFFHGSKGLVNPLTLKRRLWLLKTMVSNARLVLSLNKFADYLTVVCNSLKEWMSMVNSERRYLNKVPLQDC